MAYLFRLTFGSTSAGVFHFDDESRSFKLRDGTTLNVQARDANNLREARRLHIESCGFKDEKSARLAGENLRLRLRLINVMFGLGLSIPTKDYTEAVFSDEIKQSVLESCNGIAHDSVIGLAVWPDNGLHFEYVIAAHAAVYPSDPTYLFKAIDKIWGMDVCLDDRSEDSLRFLGLSLAEQSQRTRFLLTYLAVERMVETRRRSKDALAVIDEMANLIKDSILKQREKDSLITSVLRLRERSSSSELADLGRRVQTDELYLGMPVAKFIGDCIETRHKIAHEGASQDEASLQSKSDALRRFCLRLIWTRNKIQNISLDQPASTVSVPDGGFTIRVI